MNIITPSEDDLQQQDIAKILGWAYRILPVFYGIIIAIRIFSNGWPTVFAMLAAILMIPPANYFLKKGKVETSLFLLVVSLILVVTVAITYANGIHDIGLLAYPVLLLISSLTLKTWQQIFGFSLVMISIIWLALGEEMGYYKPEPIHPTTLSDLIVMIVIIVVSALICYKIGFYLKKALSIRDNEIQLTSRKVSLLQKSLDQKIAITHSIHLQVVESISIIRELLNHQKNQPFTNLPYQLFAIELVHSELHKLELEKELDLENYLDALIIKHPTPFINITKGEMDDIMVNVDRAMSIGLLITELGLNNALEGKLCIKKEANAISLIIDEIPYSLEISTLADIMIRQLAAELTNEKGIFKIYLAHSN